MKQPVLPEKTEKVSPPYLPYRTLRNFLDSLRVGIPGKIDRSVLKNLSGSAQSMLIGALRYFELISQEGKPTHTLERLVQAEGADRQKLLQELLKHHYSFIFNDGINLQNATPKMLQEAFTNAGISGDTTRKAIAFFLSAAKDSGMTLSSYLKVRQIGRPAGSRRRTSGTRLTQGTEGQREEEREPSAQPGTVRFNLPLPNKPPIIISVAEDLTVEDWVMVDTTIRAYIERRKKA